MAAEASNATDEVLLSEGLGGFRAGVEAMPLNARLSALSLRHGVEVLLFLNTHAWGMKCHTLCTSQAAGAC